MSTYKSFAVVGAGALIGLPIATGLAAQGVSVLILSRGSTKTAPAGVQLVQVDTSDVAAVTAVLKEHKVDVVISTVKAHDQEGAAAQMPMLEAAKAAAVKLYVPSEWGSPTDGYTEGFPGAKNKIAEHAKSVGLPTARIYCGGFTEIAPMLKGPDSTIRYIGKGETPVSFTSVADITGFVVHALTTLPPSELENRILRLEGERVTLKEVAAIFNTTAVQVESVPGPEGGFMTGLLTMCEKGAVSTGWDEANGREGSGDQAAGSANALWPGHHWQTIKEVHKL
ncbi:hypothetical protein C8R46DRAFT_1172123 [Mycena filopes]|nr:hypothetical protein C8R46DRAFT_1172123 [Mycena filopes]